MPIPFILGGIALVSGIAGIKKTFDAKSDYDSAKRMVNRAEENYRKNKRTLERKEVEIKEEISEYGEFKVRLYLEIIKDRITSYNVCYTKLLRQPSFVWSKCHKKRVLFRWASWVIV